MARYRVNGQIPASPVQVVSPGGELLAAMTTVEALELARKAGLDLVEVAPDESPVICRIMDYREFRRNRQAASLFKRLFKRPQ